jgi:NADPH:quinone reductase-like Zn-dependent oxidoreductase
MKIAYRSTYGKGDVLTVKEVQKPSPADNEVLIKVHAATVSRTDCHVLWGWPYFMRLFTGLVKPKIATTGSDFAGEIIEVGNSVKTWKPGARVMGFEFFGLRSHGEYITLPASAEIVEVPATLSWEESAACVEGGFYALNVIRRLKPQRGQTAMVAGATGAIGAATVQFFKYYGVHVTATCRGEHIDLVKKLGADRVIDYTKEDFTQDSGRYDFVVDAVGKTSFGKCKVLLKEKGMYSSSSFPELFALLFTNFLGGKKFVFAPPDDLRGCLTFIKNLAEEGKFRPPIDKIVSLEEISEAFDYVGSGQKVGSVVIRFNQS